MQLRSHRSNFSSEPSFSQRIHRTAGWLASPRDHVLVLCVDEKKTALFVDFDIASDTGCDGPRQRHQEFLAFLRQLDECVPPEFDIHLIIDNYDAHKHPDVRAWLGQRTRYHIHCSTIYSSWLNQAERWFGTIAQGTIGRAPFASVKDQVLRIDAFVQRYNRSSRPLVFTAAAADFFLQKIARVCARISETSP